MISQSGSCCPNVFLELSVPMNVRVWRILLRRLSGKIVVWIIHLPVSWLRKSQSWVNLVHFPSDSGILPVERETIYKKSKLKCTRIIHLPSSLLLSRRSSVKLIQLPSETGSETGISPVKKRDLAKFWGRSLHGLYTCLRVCWSWE